MARGAKKKHWCDCPNGPEPVVASPPPAQVVRFSVGRDVSEDSRILFAEAVDSVVDVDNLALEHVSKIEFTFWKPIVIPIDLTVELTPVKVED